MVSSVTKKLDFLCGGENAGPKKIEKAESQGVQFLNEEQFIELTNNNMEIWELNRKVKS